MRGIEFYFDHNSTSPIVESVASFIRPYLTNEFGNPSSRTCELGEHARAALETARGELTRLLNAQPGEVVFTSGGTESCFAAMIGALKAQKSKRHILVSAVEHPAVLEAANFARDVLGAEVSVVPVDQNGELDIGKLFDAIRIDTAFMSFMLANNETGVIFPLQEVVSIAHERGILVHTDAVQAVGKIPVDFQALGVDFLSLSAHKFGGVKGSGALLIRTGSKWEAVMKGGGQELGRRGGTESVALIAAMGEAARTRRSGFEQNSLKKLSDLRDFFESSVRDRIPGVELNGARTQRLPNTSSLRFEGVLAQDILPVLAKRGIIVSAGSACKTANVEPSHVLKAMGLTTIDCLSTLRFSFGLETSREALFHAVDILAETMAYFRAHSSEQLQANFRA